MSPILPSTGMQVEAHREQYAPENEHEYAQKHGHVLQPYRARSRVRSWPVLLIAVVIITLAVLLLI